MLKNPVISKVFVTDLERKETVQCYDLEKRVKRLATSSEFTFYAAAENGKVFFKLNYYK